MARILKANGKIDLKAEFALMTNEDFDELVNGKYGLADTISEDQPQHPDFDETPEEYLNMVLDECERRGVGHDFVREVEDREAK